MLLRSQNGVQEATGKLQLQYSLGTRQFTGRFETKLVIRIDTRAIPIYEAVADVVRWWEEEADVPPTHVPAAAKEPVYSFWYSYHRTINEQAVEAECRRAKELGFDLCIVDDGWQTDSKAHGYPGSTAWIPAPSKFPDMTAHVQRVHDMGMKYMLRFSVPFVHSEDPTFPDWEPYLLRPYTPGFSGVLDPRYKAVREHLLEIYKNALLQWKLDGFKLDFIDSWCDHRENYPYSPAMDVPSLQDAVNLFLTSVIQTLRAIKPDVLIEFRQRYIGPQMRRFGNMFRVGDCPYDYISNRTCLLDLRMLSGSTAVHSDMLMWHPNEPAENAALQIISVLFGVLQYSARLDLLQERTAKMSRFWLDFMKTHREVLLEGTLRSYEPHLFYTWAQSTLGDTCIAAVYAGNTCITPENTKTLYLANGTMEDRILCQMDRPYRAQILNCCGETVAVLDQTDAGLTVIPVPSGGLAVLTSL